MSSFVELPKTLRRVGVVAAAAALSASAALVAAAPGASAAATTAVNCSATYLQNAIDTAAPGATLGVTGTCLGNYTIDKNLTLLGQGTAVLDGQHGDTTLAVSSGATVRLANLTITDGNASGAGDGGGVKNSGALTLDQVNVTNSDGSDGGGIYSSGALTVNDSTISGNSVSVFGGGIYNDGAMTVAGSNVTGNSAAYSGGGILSGFGFDPVTLKDSTISNNTAGTGAGIFNILDSETLTNTRVIGNTATYEAGGIDNNAGTTTLVDSTVTHNAARLGEGGTFAGGIFDFSGTVPLRNSTVSGNTPDNCDPPGYVSGCSG